MEVLWDKSQGEKFKNYLCIGKFVGYILNQQRNWQSMINEAIHQCIEVVHMTYGGLLKCIPQKHGHNLLLFVSRRNKNQYYQRVDNNILLNRLHYTMSTVNETGSNPLC